MWSDPRLILFVVAASAMAGSLFSWSLHSQATAQGAVTGACIGLLWIGFEELVTRRVRRVPFGIALLLRALGLTCVIAAGLAAGTFAFGASPDHAPFSLASLSWYWQHGSWLRDLIFSFAVGTTFTSIRAVNLLIGPGLLLQVLLGRYFRPRVEERVFLFADLVGSTAIAERLGDLRFHSLVQAVITDFSPPIARNRGRVDRYIGDAVIVTWPRALGLGQARALRCCFEMRDGLADAAGSYRERFGLVPTFRAALHAGPVVAGEVGVAKREILFLGDTVNTTARVEEACRTLGRALLVTREIVEGGDLPPGWVVEPLGTFQPRGRERPMELFTVERRRPGATGE